MLSKMKPNLVHKCVKCDKVVKQIMKKRAPNTRCRKNTKHMKIACPLKLDFYAPMHMGAQFCTFATLLRKVPQMVAKYIRNGDLDVILVPERQHKMCFKDMLKQTLEKTRNVIESRLQNGSPQRDFFVVSRSLGLKVPQGGPKDSLRHPPRSNLSQKGTNMDRENLIFW